MFETMSGMDDIYKAEDDLEAEEIRKSKELLNKYGLPSEERFGRMDIFSIVNKELFEQKRDMIMLVEKEIEKRIKYEETNIRLSKDSIIRSQSNKDYESAIGNMQTFLKDKSRLFCLKDLLVEIVRNLKDKRGEE